MFEIPACHYPRYVQVACSVCLAESERVDTALVRSGLFTSGLVSCYVRQFACK